MAQAKLDVQYVEVVGKINCRVCSGSGSVPSQTNCSNCGGTR